MQSRATDIGGGGGQDPWHTVTVTSPGSRPQGRERSSSRYGEHDSSPDQQHPPQQQQQQQQRGASGEDGQGASDDTSEPETRALLQHNRDKQEQRGREQQQHGDHDRDRGLIDRDLGDWAREEVDTGAGDAPSSRGDSLGAGTLFAPVPDANAPRGTKAAVTVDKHGKKGASKGSRTPDGNEKRDSLLEY